MNKRYKELLALRIEIFLNEYRSSNAIFEDMNKNNNLIHPSEYGAYREKICDELIKFSIPSKFETGTGFLINSLDEVSTQIDILIFDLDNTPFIQSASKTRFFPVESVVAVGEIKSKLNIKTLCDAAVKLAEIKKMKQIIPSDRFFCVDNENKEYFDPKVNCYDTLFSFLICEKIENFESDNVFTKLDEAYKDAGIKYEYRHNVILSIKGWSTNL